MLSVIIPARNEQYLEKTIRSVLAAAQGKIEILAMLDGYKPDPQIIINDQRVYFVHYEKSIGQRQAINRGAKIAKGKYIMKLDAHCNVDEGFDIKLAADCEYDWTVIPRMYNLDIATWKPKKHKRTDYMYISSPHAEKPFRAQYYEGREKDNFRYQPKNKKMIDDIMCCMGPCFFMHKQRFFELGGCDEGHGHWGQQGIEVALKAWLSGGSLKVNKNTWFAHWFRGGGGPGFPWPASGRSQENARKYSRKLWLNNKWSLQKRKLQWLVDKFDPPGWETMSDLTILFYTANVIDSKIMNPVIRSLKKHGYPIISISQKPMGLGTNILFEDGRSIQNIYKQVLVGARKASTKYVALCEDDCLYTTEHFKFRPKKAGFAYNLNRWNLHLKEEIYSYRKRPILSQCIADRQILIDNLEERFRLSEIPKKYCGEMGLYEKQLKMSRYEYETFETKKPNMIVSHQKGIIGRKLIKEGAPTKTTIPVWNDADYWIKKFKGASPLERQKIKLRSQHSHIANITLDVEEMCVNRLNYVEPGKGGSLKQFMKVFPLFIKYVAQKEGKPEKVMQWLPANKLKTFEYYDYLVSKLNPVDRNPLTPKGSRHCLNLMRDAAKLYISLKEDGLRNPLDIYKDTKKERFSLHRGGRRLEILRQLGHKKVPCRVFESRDMFIKLNPEKNITVDNSIHAIGMKQFQELGDQSTDKYWVHTYTRLYDAHIGYMRPTARKILEIGVLRGASLLLWKEAFPKAHIVGVDIKQRHDLLFDSSTDKRITFLLGNQQDQTFLKNSVIAQGPYDIIIDDASHRGDKMIKSFQLLWKSLAPGGWYVLEDLYGHYRKGRASMMPFIKDRIDTMNVECTIKSMHFYYNICFIQKG
jgi:glycosyltransferase involved in cell wall biosynthesis